MALTNLTLFQENFIKTNYPNITVNEISRSIGVSKDIVRYRLKKWNLYKSKPLRKVTKKDEEFIRCNYIKLPINEIARQLNLTKSIISHRLKIWNLVIPSEVIRLRHIENGKRHKGRDPVNKGKKMIDIVDPKKYDNWLKSARKSLVPGNSLMPKGTIRYHKSGHSKIPFIKITHNHWKPLHIHLWNTHYGDVPNNHIIVVKDKSKSIQIENIDCISISEKCMRTRDDYQNYPDSIKPLVSLTYKLAHKIKEHENK